MKVNLSMSKRKDRYGRSEILLLVRRRLDGKVIDIRAKSGVFIDPRMFDAKKKSVKTFAANKLLTDEVRYHNSQLKKLDNLFAKINEAYNSEPDKNNVCSKWLDRVVHCEKETMSNASKGIFQLFTDFVKSKSRSKSNYMSLMACARSVVRYEAYVRITSKAQRNFKFDVNSVKKKDIEDYISYFSNEKRLAEENRFLFDRLVSSYPPEIKKGCNMLKERGGNYIHVTMRNLKQFFVWLNREKITSNNPFEGVEIGVEKYGTPYYITIEERDRIASTTMPTKTLETQRDIFVFQCLIGCRVSDLMRLTKDNITNGILVYTPHKTKNEGQQAFQARVPLHDKAIELVNKYKGEDRQGRLFPTISANSYNKYIREFFTISGITRMVEVRNTHTGEIENRPINEVASSHLARRTFVGNLYSKVADPNLIGKMSGHVDGSKAFARYRKIEDETLKSVIDMI